MIRLAATTPFALILAACAATTSVPEDEALPPYEPPASLAEATEGPSNVAMYVAGDDDTTVYMIGTVHILRPDVAWKTAAYERAFAEADALYVEADTSDETMAALQPVVMELGLNPPGTTLSSYLAEDQRAKLATVLAGLDLPMQNVEPMRPWLASTMIGAVGIQSLGGDPAAGVEAIIEADAEAAGLSVRTLETARQQLEMIASPPDQAWADALAADLDEFEDFERYFAHLVGAWYDGRMDEVGTLMNDGLNADDRLAEALLYERNADWADQLGTLIETEEGVFLVAVGAGHLAGERSVQDYLEDAGYPVRPYE